MQCVTVQALAEEFLVTNPSMAHAELFAFPTLGWSQNQKIPER